MKISLKWMKEYVSVGISVDQLVHKLTMAGLEVESVSAVQGDTVLDLEITPNRPDCLNMLGLARELSAILDKDLRLPVVPDLPAGLARCAVEIDNAQDCPRYIGTVIDAVRVKEAPAKLRGYLTALGGRTINNIVDITNFCLLETGQPLHAFDYDKLAGGKIVVRRARAGESLVTLDGVARELNPEILVIADAERPVALAGIMGGMHSEVSSATRRILLESASFDPVVVRRGARALGLSTEASYRFERGVDCALVSFGADRAIGLILKHAAGTVTARRDLFPGRRTRGVRPVTVSGEQINTLLGATIPLPQARAILKRLGFTVRQDSRRRLVVTPPSFRGDIHREVDVIEEIARVIGYDQLPASLPQVRISQILPTGPRAIRSLTRETLVAQGFSEIISYSLINADSLRSVGLDDLSGIRVQNPLSRDQEILRPSLLPSFLSVVRSNMNRGQRDLRLFEVGRCYFPAGERDTVGLVMTGRREQDWRVSQKARVDFYDLSGPVDQVLTRVCGAGGRYAPSRSPIFVPGCGAEVFLAEQRLGELGQVKPEILQAWDIKNSDLFFAQLDLASFKRPELAERRYRPPSEYPAVTRDVSLAVRQEISFQQIRDLVWQQGGDLLKELSFLEEYRGDKLPAGCRGLVFSLVYQSCQQTLTEEEVNALHAKILAALVERFAVTVR